VLQFGYIPRPWPGVAPVLLSELLSAYFRERLDLTVGSQQQLAIAVLQFSRWLGRDATVTDLTRTNILDFMRWLGISRSPRTVNIKRAYLVTLWRYAAASSIVVPPGAIMRVREPRRLPVGITVDDFSRLLAAASHVTGTWEGVPTHLCWRIAFLLLWDSAERIAPLLLAQMHDIDLTAGTWFVPAESRKRRQADRLYQLHPQTIDAIRATLQWPRERVIPFPRLRQQLWRKLGQLCRSVGLPNDRLHKFHCIRRSAESYGAAARGVEWAAAAVGHSTVIALRSYICPAICRAPALVDVLPRPVF
jgi:integrase